MPNFHDIVTALGAYRNRYRFLDAFVDDIDEFRDPTLLDRAAFLTQGSRPQLAVEAENARLLIDVFREQGIARFQLAEPRADGTAGVVAAGALGALLGAAVQAARGKKEGLLGGLVLGMLVGGVMGAAAPPVEPVLALQFDPTDHEWRLYDGALMRWAKQTLQPAA